MGFLRPYKLTLAAPRPPIPSPAPADNQAQGKSCPSESHPFLPHWTQSAILNLHPRIGGAKRNLFMSQSHWSRPQGPSKALFRLLRAPFLIKVLLLNGVGLACCTEGASLSVIERVQTAASSLCSGSRKGICLRHWS